VYALLVAVAVPLDQVVNWPLLAPAGAFVLAWLLAVKRAPAGIVVLGSCLLVALALFGNMLAQAGVQGTALHITDPGADALASVTWQQFNAALVPSALWWPGKIVTLLPLVLLAALALAGAGPQASRSPFRYVRA
jgi:hypothetical protein